MKRFRVPDNLPRRIFRARVVTATIEVVTLALILFMEGELLWDSRPAVITFYSMIGLLISSSVYRHTLRMMQAIYKRRCLKSIIPDIVLTVATLLLIPDPPSMALVASVGIIYDIFRIFKKTGTGRWFINQVVGTPEKTTAFSFIVMIVIGTVLLMLPRASASNVGIDFVDALFTATSAHCVTGLTVVNTAVDGWGRSDLPAFSTFGQLVILLLIQIGGLGIMTLSSASIALFSGKLRFDARDFISRSVARDESALTVASMVRYILVMTLIIESIGAGFLSVRFWAMFPDQPQHAVWLGVFHSVSAFCNAGFSLFSTSLVQFRTDPFINLVVMTLIILGGLGFPVVAALFSVKTWSQGFKNGISTMTIHTRLVLLTTGILLAGGTVALFIFDYNGAQQGFSLSERLWASVFQSVTARTAGFNTVDISKSTTPAVMVLLFLMFVGAAPGGTGGGIKITTFALIVLSVKATMRRRADIELFRRSVHGRTVHNIVVIAFVSLMACFCATFLLTWLEPTIRLERAMFETVSAFGTVGLSMDVTMNLGSPAKILLTLLMYLGRIGPLTLTLALARRMPVGVSYPQGKVLVG